MVTIKKTKICKCLICDSNFEGPLHLQKRFYICPVCKEKKYKVKIEKKNKNHICINCNEEFIGSIYLQKKFCICSKCRNKGIKGQYDETQKQKVNIKRKKTCLKKYGVDNVLKDNKIKEKANNTCIDRFGVPVSLMNPIIKKKAVKTLIRNYGKEGFKNSKIQDKRKETCLNNFGVDHHLKNKQIKNKIQRTIRNKYGVDYIFSSKDIQEKIKKTNIERYGFACPMKNKDINNKHQNVKKQNKLKNIFPLLKKWGIEIDGNYINSKTPVKVKCIFCNKYFEDSYMNIRQRAGKCVYCSKIGKRSSVFENELLSFIKSITNKEIILNNRSIIKPKELDIYIPSLNLAIEFDGLYWHSEANNIDKLYHLNKTSECEKKGIKLIHIFEDEWVYKKEIVKQRLKQILKYNKNKIRIHGRKCEIKEINSKIKNEFLEKYHLQGKDNSVIKLGAFYNNEIVSVMTFSYGSISKGTTPSKNRENNIWELNRFCLNYNYHIPGIASKFLKYFQRRYIWTKIFSYADRRWSQGNVYEKLGFNLVKLTLPNYWYVNGNKRIHRFKLRKKKSEPKNISEKELRILEGYTKIWDCGNLKFEIKNKGVKRKNIKNENKLKNNYII